MGKWKRRPLVTIGILVVIAIISIPYVILLARMSAETATEEKIRQQELRFAFVERYGSEAMLVEIVEPQDLYIYVWELEEGGIMMRHFTLAIDGLFVELGRVAVRVTD